MATMSCLHSNPLPRRHVELAKLPCAKHSRAKPASKIPLPGVGRRLMRFAQGYRFAAWQARNDDTLSTTLIPLDDGLYESRSHRVGYSITTQ
jgi:hypothetical protein